ncbi:MAG: hypothetical protein ACMVY4_13915 [Minwuia sp.]|uniref:hypothetical protein n=1 Tax=Minwuia sp. TaxID=2493630 RepID=UPI003A8B7EEC
MMKRLAILTILAAVVAAAGAASAKPYKKATNVPFAVKLEWASQHQLINALQLSCRISDHEGRMVGRGVFETRLDPAFLSRRGAVEAVMPAVVQEGADPELGFKCSCRARFDTRSIFFRSGVGDFGQLPWMFARPRSFAETSCAPLPMTPKES